MFKGSEMCIRDSDSFGQIFITDTNREHLDRILHKVGSDYKMFRVEQGTVAEMKEEEA